MVIVIENLRLLAPLYQLVDDISAKSELLMVQVAESVSSLSEMLCATVVEFLWSRPEPRVSRMVRFFEIRERFLSMSSGRSFRVGAKHYHFRAEQLRIFAPVRRAHSIFIQRTFSGV